MIKNNIVFDSILSEYQNNLTLFLIISISIFRCHMVTLKRGESYIEAPYWLKNKNFRESSK